MGHRSFVAPEATARLFAAARWYQTREPTAPLGLELLAEFDEVVELAREYPEMFALYERDTRQAVLKRLPYAIYYIVETDRIVVVNFLAMRQEREPRRDL